MASKPTNFRIDRPNMRLLLVVVALLFAGCSSCGGGGGSDNGVTPVELPEFDADRAFADIEHQSSEPACMDDFYPHPSD